MCSEGDALSYEMWQLYLTLGHYMKNNGPEQDGSLYQATQNGESGGSMSTDSTMSSRGSSCSDQSTTSSVDHRDLRTEPRPQPLHPHPWHVPAQSSLEDVAGDHHSVDSGYKSVLEQSLIKLDPESPSDTDDVLNRNYLRSGVSRDSGYFDNSSNSTSNARRYGSVTAKVHKDPCAVEEKDIDRILYGDRAQFQRTNLSAPQVTTDSRPTSSMSISCRSKPVISGTKLSSAEYLKIYGYEKEDVHLRPATPGRLSSVALCMEKIVMELNNHKPGGYGSIHTAEGGNQDEVAPPTASEEHLYAEIEDEFPWLLPAHPSTCAPPPLPHRPCTTGHCSLPLPPPQPPHQHRSLRSEAADKIRHLKEYVQSLLGPGTGVVASDEMPECAAANTRVKTVSLSGVDAVTCTRRSTSTRTRTPTKRSSCMFPVASERVGAGFVRSRSCLFDEDRAAKCRENLYSLIDDQRGRKSLSTRLENERGCSEAQELTSNVTSNGEDGEYGFSKFKSTSV